MKRRLIFISIFILGITSHIPASELPKRASDTSQILSIFSPGFFEKRSVSTQQAARYAKNNIIQTAYTACPYNDTRANANFGQDGDIAVLAEQYFGCCNANPHTQVILTGLSRGASTLFNFVGKKKPKNISAIIAESPFASVDDIVEHRISQWYMNWVPGIHHMTVALMKLLYPAYNLDGPQPITSITQDCPTVPMLIVCSKQDDIIPYTSSVRLAYALKEKGHEVYLLIFQEGAHGYLSYKEEFQVVANALYARYNLPHNAELAQQGASKLERYKL